MNDNLLVIFVTCPQENAEAMAGELVESKLAACVNIVPVKSMYIWDDELHHDDESLLLIKTTSGAYQGLEKKIRQIHPYDVPEIVAIRAESVQEDYLKWVNAQTRYDE